MSAPATHVLLIGIGEYPFAGNFGVMPLSSTVASALALKACFEQADFSFGERPLAPPICLTGADTTFINIRKAIRHWAQRVAEKPGNLGILYLSGHGVRDGDNDVLLCRDFGKVKGDPWDGSADLTGTWRAIIRKAKNDVLMLVDICRINPSGNLPRGQSRFLLTAERHEDLAHGFCHIFSTREGSEAHGHRAGHSWFMDAVLRALRGYSADRDEARLSTWRVDTDLFERTVSELLDIQSGQAGHPQLPTHGGSRHFPLIRLARPPQIEIIRRLLDRRRELAERFTRVTEAKVHGSLPRDDVVFAIQARGKEGASRVVWILGPPGSGKSTAMAHVAKTIAGSISVYISQTEGVQSIRDVNEYILESIGEWLTEDGRRTEGFARWAHLRPDDHPRMLLIDGLDEADTLPRKAADLGLPPALPAGLVVVLGMRGSIRPRFAIDCAQVEYRLDKENQAQRALVAQFISSDAAAFAPLREIAECKAEGNFLHAKLMIDMALVLPGDAYRALADASRTLEGFTELALERAVSTARDPELAAALLGAIATVAEPSDARLLAALVDAATYDAEATLHELGQGLVGHCLEGDRTSWRFEHSLFATTAYRLYRGASLENKMVDGFLSHAWSRLEHRAYCARWQTYHMRRTGRLQELRALVLDRNWIESQLAIDPCGGLVRNDLDNLKAEHGSPMGSSALAQGLTMAAIRSSTQAWWSAVCGQMDIRDIFDAGVMTSADVSYLLRNPAEASITQLNGLFAMAEAEDVRSAVEAWIKFAEVVSLEEDRARILEAVVPYVDESDLVAVFEAMRKFAKRDSFDRVLHPIFDTHGVSCLPLVDALWRDYEDYARHVAVNWIELPDGKDLELLRELAWRVLRHAEFAYEEVVANFALLHTEADPVMRRHWVSRCRDAVIKSHTCSYFDRLIQVLHEDELEGIIATVTAQISDWWLRALAEDPCRPSALDMFLLKKILLFEEQHARLRYLAALVGTSSLSFPQLVDVLLAEEVALRSPYQRKNWLKAAISLMESTDLGSRDAEFCEVVTKNLALIEWIGDLEFQKIRLNKLHPVTRVAVTLFCQWCDREKRVIQLGSTWWTLLPLCKDVNAAGALLVATILDTGVAMQWDDCERARLQFAPEVLDIAEAIALKLADAEQALFALLFLSVLSTRPANDAVFDLTKQPELRLDVRPLRQWQYLLDRVTLLPAERQAQPWVGIRAQLLAKLVALGYCWRGKRLSRSEALAILLRMRDAKLMNIMSSLAGSLLSNEVLDPQDIQNLRSFPSLLASNLVPLWRALGASVSAIHEIIEWRIANERDVSGFLQEVMFNDDRDCAIEALNLYFSREGDAQVEHWTIIRALELEAVDLSKQRALLERISDSERNVGVLLGAIQRWTADEETIKQFWGRAWLPQVRIDAVTNLAENAPDLFLWALDQLATWIEHQPSDPQALKSLRWLLADDQSKTLRDPKIWKRLIAIEHRWAKETHSEERILESDAAEIKLPPFAELAELERKISHGIPFDPSVAHLLWQRSTTDDVAFRERVADALVRIDLWNSDHSFYRIAEMIPSLGIAHREVIRRRLVELFMGESNPLDHFHASSDMAPLLEDGELVQLVDVLEHDFPPAWAAQSIQRLTVGRNAECKHFAETVAIRLAHVALTKYGPAYCVETLAVSYISSPDHYQEVAALIQRLPTAGLQAMAIAKVRFSKELTLGLARNCGPMGPLSDLVIENLNDREIVGLLEPQDFVCVIERLGRLEFDRASRCIPGVLVAMLPHLGRKGAQFIFRTLLSAWMPVV